MLRAKIRNASTSMSKRAPCALAVPVRRAIHPSTASRTRARAARLTSAGTETDRSIESATRAETTAARVARTSVTRSAGPNELTSWRANATSTIALTATAARAPTAQPTGPNPTVALRTASSAAAVLSPIAEPVRTVNTLASVSKGYRIGTDRTRSGFSERSEDDDRGAARGPCVLGARTRGGRDPAGGPGDAGPGRRRRPHAALRDQPRDRDAGVPRSRPGEPVRGDAGAVPGG